MEQNSMVNNNAGYNNSLYSFDDLIYIGAESRIYLCNFLGKKAIAKFRRKKPYFEEELWNKLSYTRTKRELKLLSLIRKLGLNSPKIYFFDANTNTLIMEYIEGISLYESDNIIHYEKAAEILNTLHQNKIWHGDFQPKNILISGDKLFVIDFGLSKLDARNEEMAYDILTFVKSNVKEELIHAFLQKYKTLNNNVYRAYEKISSLGRYK
ncbi:MAG: KEOPS complex kinase/ATPase Bud32 [Candidatus Anstonellales archaeon]